MPHPDVPDWPPPVKRARAFAFAEIGDGVPERLWHLRHDTDFTGALISAPVCSTPPTTLNDNIRYAPFTSIWTSTFPRVACE